MSANASVYHTSVCLQPHSEDLLRFQSEAVWIFPKHYTDFHASGACVYFITCECHPQLVKIGFTNTSLSSRRTHIEGLFKSAAAVQAFAKHLSPRKFEQALHQYFAPFRLGAYEWFDRDAVDAWLDQFRSAS